MNKYLELHLVGKSIGLTYVDKNDHNHCLHSFLKKEAFTSHTKKKVRCPALEAPRQNSTRCEFEEKVA